MEEVKCESGTGFTEDGSGLCQRRASKKVEFSRTRNGVEQSSVFDMCGGCAAHWSLMHPRTVKILSA